MPVESLALVQQYALQLQQLEQQRQPRLRLLVAAFVGGTVWDRTLLFGRRDISYAQRHPVIFRPLCPNNNFEQKLDGPIDISATRHLERVLLVS